MRFWFNVEFSFDTHVKKVCGSCFTQMHDLSNVFTYEAVILTCNTLLVVILANSIYFSEMYPNSI